MYQLNAMEISTSHSGLNKAKIISFDEKNLYIGPDIRAGLAAKLLVTSQQD
jgi:hypothetical protein